MAIIIKFTDLLKKKNQQLKEKTPSKRRTRKSFVSSLIQKKHNKTDEKSQIIKDDRSCND